MSSFVRTFIANGWPIRLVFIPWLGIVPIVCAAVLARAFAASRQPLSSGWDLLQVSGFALLAWLVCFLIALVLGSISMLLMNPLFTALDRWAGVTPDGRLLENSAAETER